MSNAETFEFGILNEPFYAQNILRLVFKYLNQKDRLNCARVCRLWYQIAMYNDVYASMSFFESHLEYRHLFQRMKFYGTKHLILKRCHSVDKQRPSFRISLPQLKTVYFEHCCDFVINVLIAISPNLEKIKFCARPSFCLRRKGDTKYYGFGNVRSSRSWDVPIRLPRSIKSVKSLSIKFWRGTEYYNKLIKACVRISKLELYRSSDFKFIKLSKFTNLVTINLIDYHVSEDLEEALSECNNLKYLTIAPFGTDHLSHELHNNTTILKCAHRLGHSLKVFTWVFTEPYLRIARRTYATFTGTEISSSWKTGKHMIPIILDVSQPSFQRQPFVPIDCLEKYLRQQNWSASVKVYKMSEAEKYQF
ncbi:hypothetical protein ABEB36_002495 [Hypothenemus hampei]|uniref:F-box domain-containing protein n=1 Tax=Hypothenemus hampei TaxID=57062 RepID=A0ABD1F910_HYPHA